MANKDLFKQAIAEAKSVREAAIANAKEALEETLTPQLKDLLAAKLQEMEEKEEEVTEEKVEETNGFIEVQAEAEDDSEETEDGEEKAEPEAEEPEAEEAGENEEMEDMDLKDLSVSDFKDLIRDIIAQEMDAGEAEPEMGADMDAGAMDEPSADDLGMEPEMGADDEEEIDLDELLRELEGVTEETTEELSEKDSGKDKEESSEEVYEEVSEEVDEKKEEALPITASADTLTKIVHSLLDSGKIQSETADDFLNAISNSPSLDVYEEKEADNNLSEALETVETLKAQLSEVNLLNAKLLYVNKVFKANNLTESQKVSIIAAFDKAETVKEVKLVFETVSENVVAKKTTTPIKENKLGMASKATGTTASKKEVISEVSDAVLRMQKLAGII